MGAPNGMAAADRARARGQPRVSIVVPSFNARGTIAACLSSLRRQTFSDFEVLVVDSSQDGTERLVARNFPEVRLLHYNSRKYCGQARNLGLSWARGKIIAQIDADCVADPDWLECLLAAHDQGYQAVGGALANGNPDSLVAWGAYFSEFSQWLPTNPAGFHRDLAGANVSYYRSLLEQYGPFLEDCYGSDSEFHWRLAGASVPLRFEPAMVVRHISLERLSAFLNHEREHGRHFARVRCGHQGWGPARRAGYALALPLLVVRVLAKRVRQVWPLRDYRRQFLRAALLVALGVAYWCLGEAEGYLRGPFPHMTGAKG